MVELSTQSEKVATMIMLSRFRECCLIVVVLLVYGLPQIASSESSTSNSCTYFFIRQPRTDMSCNPWPFITSRNLMLQLSCDIRGPQSNDLPNAVWYHRNSIGITERIYIDNTKYQNPTYNGDLGNGFRQVNFTLLVSSVRQFEDIGCYWCEVDISNNNCSFSLINSTQFCLYAEETYSQLPDCTSLPVNDSTVCAANMVCDINPSNATTPEIVRTTAVSNQLSVTTIFDRSSTIKESTSTLPNITPSITVPQDRGTETQSIIPRMSMTLALSTSSHTYSTSLLPSTSTPPPLVSPLMTASTEPTDSQSNSRSPQRLSALQVSFYIGLSVCVVLLMIIVALVAVVVLLCRKKPSKHPSNSGITSESSMSSSDDHNRIWRRESGDHLGTSVVNSSSTFALLSPTPWSLSNNLSDDDDDPLYSSVDRGEQTHPFPENSQSTTNDHIPRIPMRHAPKELQDSVANKSSKVVTTERAPSPDTHYYHVLEQPEYYNYDWLSRNSNGRDLLLQSWRERSTNGKEGADGKKKWQSVNVAVEDETGEEMYHWRVVPPAKQQQVPTRERVGSKSSLSRGSQRTRRHPYQRLDQATLETAREYAKVSITTSNKSISESEAII